MQVAEEAVRLFITNDKVNVAGLILAGSADFKTELGQSDMFDGRLQAKIIKTVDVSYGGENGFNQAIELSGRSQVSGTTLLTRALTAESLSNVKFIKEKKLICMQSCDWAEADITLQPSTLRRFPRTQANSALVWPIRCVPSKWVLWRLSSCGRTLMSLALS